IIPKVRGHIQRRVLEALSSTDDLEKPGSHETTIGRLCNTAGLSEEQVRRALAAMHHDGAIDYKRPFRGRGIEKLVHSPPPFDKVLIDWKRQEQLRSAEEEKLSAMERYISNKGCRRASILNYFGEQDTADCGKCDNCGKTPEGDITGPAKEALYQEVALPVLVCVLHLPFPLGRNKIARIVTGSRSKNLVSLGLDINPAFGTVKAGQDYVKEVINNLILAGYLERKGEAGRPVLALSGTGRKAALAFKLDEITADGPQPAGTPGTKAPESTDKDIRHAVLKCVLSLPKPLGATKVAAILAGSKAEWIQSSDAAHLEVYGSLHATQKRIRETIHSMMEEKLFYQGGSSLYPVIEMAEAGLSALERLEGEPVAGGAREISRDRKVLSAQEQGSPDRPETESASCELDLKIRNFLTLETGKAKRILPELRKCRPRETARQLELNYDYTDDTRTRARAVWAAGELCGQYGSDFLIRCAGSSLYSIRSLAAEALGKVGSGACDKPEGIKDNMEKARQALAELRKDPDPQVRQIAGKALESFRLDAREKTS
ncbi:MAG: RQC domain-containing protein, partial [Gemmatimonadota bacterium]|nr:RQC domain-containing protein [Gemmatimonadota bacterium]